MKAVRRLLSRPISTTGTLISPDRTQQEASQIVTEGLVGHWDAWNPYSYPGSGTTWTDLAGNGNLTLTNGPTFSSEAYGEISFDGTNDYATAGSISAFNSNSMAISVEAVFHFNGNSQLSVIANNRPASGNPFDQFSIGIGGSGQDDYANGTAGTAVHAFFYPSVGSNQWRSPRFSMPQAGIYHVIGTSESANAKLYVNGVLQSTDTRTSSGNFSTSTKTFELGKLSGLSTAYFSSRIHIVRVYTRTLTESEAYQNYQSVRWRFSL